jgi:hypothetical protein
LAPVTDAAAGIAGDAAVVYAVVIVTPSVVPQSNAAVDASGMNVIPIGIASVITIENALADE